MSARTRAVVLAWLPAVLYMASIWAVSSIALPELPLASIPLRDKMVHALEYAGLALFAAHAALRTWPDRSRARLAALTILIASAWGVLDEIHQAFVPGRSSDLFDVLADITGAVVGTATRFALSAIRARFVRPSSPVPT